MVGYLEVQGAEYNTDQEEAINFLMQMQVGQAGICGPKWVRKYGTKDSDT